MMVAMTQQAHDTREAHAGAEHLGRVGMAEPVAGDANRVRKVVTMRGEEVPELVVAHPSTANAGHEP